MVLIVHIMFQRCHNSDMIMAGRLPHIFYVLFILIQLFWVLNGEQTCCSNHQYMHTTNMASMLSVYGVCECVSVRINAYHCMHGNMQSVLLSDRSILISSSSAQYLVFCPSPSHTYLMPISNANPIEITFRYEV